MTWTPERDAELRRMRGIGMSYAEIAQALGVTKNAVVGRGQRLGLGQPPAAVTIDAPAQAEPAGASVETPALSAAKPSQPGPGDCHFPLWGQERPTHRYCGAAAKPGSSYCPEHHARCWTGIPTPRPRLVALVTGVSA